MLRVGLVVVSGLLAACSGQDPELRDPDPEPPACLVVSPVPLAFPPLEVEQGGEYSATLSVQLRSTCRGTLIVSEITSDDPAFQLEGFLGGPIHGGDEETLTVRFHPSAPGDYGGNIWIHSSDLDEPELGLWATATARAGVLQLQPPAVDFGEPYIGCELREPIRITNRGNADLRVTDVSLIDVTSGELGLDLNSFDNGSLPFTLGPYEPRYEGPAVEVFVDYRAIDTVEDHATVQLVSTDPFRPTVLLDVGGKGARFSRVIDVFEAAKDLKVDVLFTVDRSSSMVDNARLLGPHLPQLTRAFEGAGIDYQVAVIVADDGCVVGDEPFIDASFAESEAAATFDTMMDLDHALSGYGSNTERGFMLAEEALGQSVSPGCNVGLIREDAGLALIHVSDEPEQSVNSWLYYVEKFRSFKADPAAVRVHAVAGDYPTGCETASAGTGYHDAVEATDGVFLSICDPEWDDYMALLAAGSVAGQLTYHLGALPVPETIQVWINGERLHAGWHHVAGTNRLEFDVEHAPPPYATVEVIYDRVVECER